MSLNPSRVPAFPILPRNSAVGDIGHPIPIDFGEMRKLCELEESCVGADFEGICETPRKSLARFAPTDVEPSASGTLRVTTAAGVLEVSPPTLRKELLAYPLWERLSPTVVIRRRPKRMQGLGIT